MSVNTDHTVAIVGGVVNDTRSVANDASGGVNTLYLFFPLCLPTFLRITAYMNGASGDGFPLFNLKNRAGSYTYTFATGRQPVQSGLFPVDTEGDVLELSKDECYALFVNRTSADAPIAVQFGNVNGINHTVSVLGFVGSRLDKQGFRATPTPGDTGLIRDGRVRATRPAPRLVSPVRKGMLAPLARRFAANLRRQRPFR